MSTLATEIVSIGWRWEALWSKHQLVDFSEITAISFILFNMSRFAQLVSKFFRRSGATFRCFSERGG